MTPAFPRPFSADDIDPDVSYPAHVGMELRDYFAIHATAEDIEPFIKTTKGLFVERIGSQTREVWREIRSSTAEARYAFADTMMGARDAK